MWIYTELYSTSACSYSSAEYAFGVSTDSCVTQSPFFESFFVFLPVVKSFKIEGTGALSSIFFFERVGFHYTTFILHFVI